MDVKPRRKALIVLNPVSGMGNPDQLQAYTQAEFEKAGWQVSFYRTKTDDDISSVVRASIHDSCSLVVASGGDGTIAAVAAGLVGSEVPLGILPSGTWNAIARNLGIPLNLPHAVSLILGEHSLNRLDLMAVGDSIHMMNLGIGFSAAMIQNTGREEKRKFGIFAYLGNVVSQLFGLQLRRYRLDIDGQHIKIRASEIMVANFGIVGLRAFENALDIHPDDGKVDMIVVRARTILDAPVLLWSLLVKREKRTPIHRIFSGCETITITGTPPAVVQADGEIIGKTPVEIKVIPRCVQVITPVPRRTLLEEIDFLNPLTHSPER